MMHQKKLCSPLTKTCAAGTFDLEVVGKVSSTFITTHRDDSTIDRWRGNFKETLLAVVADSSHHYHAQFSQIASNFRQSSVSP